MKERLRGHRRDALLMLVGALIATALFTPAGAHVGGTVTHLWNKHIKSKVTKLVFTKAQATDRFKDARVLKSGESLSGTFSAADGNDTGSGGYLGWAITWERPLAAPLDDDNIVDVQPGDAADPNCPGPGQAAPGFLCLYNTVENGAADAYMYSEGSEVDGTLGVVIYWPTDGDVPYVGGSWTMTAP